LPAGEKCREYAPPKAGPYYRWADVRDDYTEKLPRLGEKEVREITGIAGLELGKSRFFLKLPADAKPTAGSRYIAEYNDKTPDRELNNYLCWETEAAAALRYVKGKQSADLLLIRPEYYDEFLALVDERPIDQTEQLMPGAVPDRLLGYIFIPSCDYPTTGGRGGRAVLVAETYLPKYPMDDLDLLATQVPAAPANK
jgi:hypothetical protein